MLDVATPVMAAGDGAATESRGSVRLVLVSLVVLGIAAQLWAGVRPGLGLPLGDFANYYTSARIARSGEDLTPAYLDVLWFQQRIDATGIVAQLGSFIPHPPATALVMTPLAGLDPLGAKRVWTVLNLVLAAIAVFALSRLAKIGPLESSLALLLTGTALASDLAFGQLYLLVLVSLAAGLALVEAGWRFAGGVLVGLLLVVKPFALPLVVYFAIRREWRVVTGVASGACAMTVVSIAVLGWAVHERFVATVLPHIASGTLQDPFHPYWQSWESLARRLFELEPTLNPSPALASIPLGSAVPAVAAIVGWGAVALIAWSAPNDRRLHYAAIVAASLALAPGGASYHLVLMALPFAVVASELRGRRIDRSIGLALAAVAVALAAPTAAWLRGFDGGWSTPVAYPRLWLLALFLAITLVGMFRAGERLVPLAAVWTVAVIALLGSVVAVVRARPTAPDGASPVAITAPELAGPDKTIQARPSMRGSSLTFLAANPSVGRFELFSPDRDRGRAPIGEPAVATLSPDRRRIAFVDDRFGAEDIFVRDVADGSETRITTDPGNDREPCWEDDHTIVFSSDRGRGLAYTALYRIRLGAS